MRWVAAGATHVGRVRKGNEDSYRIDSDAGIFLVADGMGGHAAGEIASRLAADAALASLLEDDPRDSAEDRLTRAFEEAHTRIRECCEGNPETEGMGTTLTVLLIAEDGTAHAGHIGDSRLYQFSGELLKQVTHDHTWVQREVDGGRMPPEEARAHPLSHILTRVLTSDEPGKPDLVSLQLKPGDVLLLSTDGLHNLVDGPQLLDALARLDPPEEICNRLIAAANRAGGFDNVTAVVVRVEGSGIGGQRSGGTTASTS